MRVALKIAYDGRSFYGHQRQPDVRTVEGECLAAFRAAKIIRGPHDAFFRSASRTDRGVSAVGNVIAFDTGFSPEAVVGAFNDRARDVWAWAVAEAPANFHPRHAVERWYRYHVLEEIPVPALRAALSLFVGEHDFRAFTSDPPRSPMSINRIDVSQEGCATRIDLRAASFRRGMVRRIVGAGLASARGEVSEDDIRAALEGRKEDLGSAPPEPLLLMDVRYAFPFQVLLKPKVRDEWRAFERDAEVRRLFIQSLRDVVSGSGNAPF